MTSSLCSVVDCDVAVQTRGLCAKHYRRLQRGGTTALRRKVGRDACRLADCARPSYSTGLCRTHKMRERRGSPLEAPRYAKRRVEVSERFWRKVDRSGDCWTWTASRWANGYGKFWGGAAWIGAHRWAYEELNGAIELSFEIDHLCRNRACVRPAHLEAVTHRENVLRGDAPTAIKFRARGAA